MGEGRSATTAVGLRLGLARVIGRQLGSLPSHIGRRRTRTGSGSANFDPGTQPAWWARV